MPLSHDLQWKRHRDAGMINMPATRRARRAGRAREGSCGEPPPDGRGWELADVGILRRRARIAFTLSRDRIDSYVTILASGDWG